MDTPKSEWNVRTAFSPGTVIAGRYEIHQKLGAGGMGVVLRARDRKLNGEEVALKIMRPQLEASDPLALQRLINEVRLARSLTHPNIVRIHDIGETEDGAAYVSMEFIEGTSLNDLLVKSRKKGVPFAEAHRILCEILKGVGFAHSKGIIHRDLKPANILVSKSGEIKIVDFGIARTIDNEIALTRPGEAVGTPAYMAPEQFRGEPLDPRCDVYALGILAHQLITGELPFASKSFFNVAMQHMNEELPPFELTGKTVPDWFETIVFTAALKDPKARYDSAQEMLQALEQRAGHVRRLKFSANLPLGWIAAAGFVFCLGSLGMVKLARDFKSPEKQNEEFREAIELEIQQFGNSNLPQTTRPPLSDDSVPQLDKSMPDKASQGQPPTVREKFKELRRNRELPARGPERRELLMKSGLEARSNPVKPPIQGQDLISGPRQLFAGTMTESGAETGRTLTIDLNSGSADLNGTLEINGYGKFRVTGQSFPKGFRIAATNNLLEIVFTGTFRKDGMGGSYEIPAQGTRGTWNARALD